MAKSTLLLLNGRHCLAQKKGILPVNFKPWPITLRVNFPYMIDEAMETIDQTVDLTEHSSPQVALVTRLYVHTGG